jgi:hypothetical protein
VGEKEKSPEEEEESVQQQPRVPCTIEGHSAVTSEIEKLILASKTDRDAAAAGFIEPVRRGRNRAPRHRYYSTGLLFRDGVYIGMERNFVCLWRRQNCNSALR